MRIFLVLLLVLNSLPAFAVTGVPDSRHWVAAGFGGAGSYTSIAPDKFVEDKVYASPDVNAPYVSTDKGENWTFLSYNAPETSNYGIQQTSYFIQSNIDANLMYAINTDPSGGLYRSTNGGTSWTRLGNYRTIAKPSKAIAIDTEDVDNVYVTSRGSVFKSADKGDTWTDLGIPFASRAATYTTKTSCETAGGTWSAPNCTLNIRFVFKDSVNNDLYLGSKKNGMVKYDLDTDTQTYVDLAGTNATWNEDFDTYLDGSSVKNFCVSAGLKVACTSNFSTWNYTAAVTTSTNYRINRLGVRRKSNGTLTFVINRAQLTSDFQSTRQYSTDGGTTWAVATIANNNTDNPTGRFTAGTPRIYSIASDPFDQNIWYMTSDWRIWRSDDGGATFAEKVKGAQNTVATDLTVAPGSPAGGGAKRMFQVGMDTGIQYSDDFGVTWTQGTPYTSKGQPYVTATTAAYGGHYWRVLTLGTEEEWNAGEGIVIASATMYGTHSSLYARNAIIRSTDSGVTYTRTFDGLPTSPLYGDTVWTSIFQGGYGGVARALAKSADESVLYVGMDGYNTQVTPRQDGGLFKSTDQGLTWTQVWGQNQTINPKDPTKVYYGIAVDPTDATGETLMFGTWGWNLYRKTGAATHSWVGATAYITNVAYDSAGTPYAVGTNGGGVIYKSVTTSFGDGSGQYGTWQLMKRLYSGNGEASGIAIDPQNDNRIFVSIKDGTPANRKIYVTTDAQNHTLASWTDITGDFPVVGGCQMLAINYHEGDQGYLYCSSNGGGIWKLNLADSPSTTPGQTTIGG